MTGRRETGEQPGSLAARVEALEEQLAAARDELAALGERAREHEVRVTALMDAFAAMGRYRNAGRPEPRHLHAVPAPATPGGPA